MKKWVIGIDEVGRGPLAGPVTVCAVAMKYPAYKAVLKMNSWKGLNDSKQLTAKTREVWYTEAQSLQKKGTILFAVSSRSAKLIDKKGIAVCIRECIADNVHKLAINPIECQVLLDGGLKAPKEYIHQTTIIRGDGSEKIISLASVIAKVTRDKFMTSLDKKHPEYLWLNNKGYGTRLHIKALKNKGISVHHRISFLSRIIDK